MPTDSSLEDIMRRADQALYAAKRQAGTGRSWRMEPGGSRHC
jgi:GGDEF domain-containing protein